MNAHANPNRLDRLAHLIARDGITHHEVAVGRIARRAAAFGLAPTATSVLADRAAAPVVRERAFARVVAALERERVRALAA
jgi:hypothetical protein